MSNHGREFRNKASTNEGWCHLVHMPCLFPDKRMLFRLTERDYREGHRINKRCNRGLEVLQLSKVELEEKRETKGVSLPLEDTALLSLECKSLAKVAQHRVLKIVLTKDQREQSVEEVERLSDFFWIKGSFASWITYFQWFWAEMKAENKLEGGKFFHVWYARSLILMSSE